MERRARNLPDLFTQIILSRIQEPFMQSFSSSQSTNAMTQVISQSGSNSACIVSEINIEQLSNGCIALTTIFAITLLIKQIRLLIESGKK